VPDADVIYERAKNAGAEILIPVRDEEYVGVVFPVAILKAIFGPSAPPILGRCRRLARRPTHLSLPEHVHVQMRHAFPRIGPAVNYDTKTVFEFEFFCNFSRGQQQVTQ